MKYIIHASFVLGALFLCNCTSSIIIKRNIHIDEVGIALTFSDSIPYDLQEEFYTNTMEFINEYNARRKHKFTLFYTDPDFADIYFDFKKSKFVTTSQNATATVVNVVGLIVVPVAMVSSGLPYFLGFYKFPKTQSFVDVTYSSQISDSGLLKDTFYNSGYLRNYPTQVNLHGKKFKYVLKTYVGRVEDQVR